MNAARLRFRVTIQHQPGPKTQNSHGDDTTPWVDLKEVWAAIEPVSGTESFSADVRISEASHVIRTRYRPGITTLMRIVRGARVFDIKSVIDADSRGQVADVGKPGRGLVLACTERGV